MLGNDAVHMHAHAVRVVNQVLYNVYTSLTVHVLPLEWTVYAYTMSGRGPDWLNLSSHLQFMVYTATDNLYDTYSPS